MTLVAVPEPATNPEAEYILLAKLLADSRSIDPVADKVLPEDFAEPFFGRVFGLIVREHGKGNPVSPLTIRPFLEGDPSYHDLGGTEFLAKIGSSYALAVNATMAAKQVAEMARRRRFMEGIKEAIAASADMNTPLDTAAELADAAIMESAERGAVTQSMSAAKAMGLLLKSAEEPKRSILSRNLPAIDDLLGGMRAKQLVIGAGRPGMGKTAAALSYAVGAAANGYGVLFVTLEMAASELMARVAADMSFNGHSGVPYADINSDNPSSRAARAIGDAIVRLEEIPLHIMDAGSLTLARLEMTVRRYKRKLAAQGHSLDLVIVDYLQLLRCDDKRISAYEAVSEISRRLKAMAKDHGVAVFALAQLSREVEKRSDKKPQLSDLRDSGQIEQDADAVLFFYRHEYYIRAIEPHHDDPDWPAWRSSLELCEGAIDFLLAKRRNGVTGSARGQFHGAYQAVRG